MHASMPDIGRAMDWSSGVERLDPGRIVGGGWGGGGRWRLNVQLMKTKEKYSTRNVPISNIHSEHAHNIISTRRAMQLTPELRRLALLGLQYIPK